MPADAPVHRGEKLYGADSAQTDSGVTGDALGPVGSQAAKKQHTPGSIMFVHQFGGTELRLAEIAAARQDTEDPQVYRRLGSRAVRRR